VSPGSLAQVGVDHGCGGVAVGPQFARAAVRACPPPGDRGDRVRSAMPMAGGSPGDPGPPVVSRKERSVAVSCKGYRGDGPFPRLDVLAGSPAGTLTRPELLPVAWLTPLFRTFPLRRAFPLVSSNQRRFLCADPSPSCPFSA